MLRGINSKFGAPTDFDPDDLSGCLLVQLNTISVQCTVLNMFSASYIFLPSLDLDKLFTTLLLKGVHCE